MNLNEKEDQKGRICDRGYLPPILHQRNTLQAALAGMGHLVNMMQEEALQVLEDGLGTFHAEVVCASTNPSLPYVKRARDDPMAGPAWEDVLEEDQSVREDGVPEFWACDD
jgi:hypothetical protein